MLNNNNRCIKTNKPDDGNCIFNTKTKRCSIKQTKKLSPKIKKSKQTKKLSPKIKKSKTKKVSPKIRKLSPKIKKSKTKKVSPKIRKLSPKIKKSKTKNVSPKIRKLSPNLRKNTNINKMSDIQDKMFNRNTFSPMLANRYNGQDVIGYYMSEKLDGYRALFYNGKEPMFLSRNNKPFHAPKWFVEDIGRKLPEGILLDGELYTKRGDFRGMGIVRKKNPIDSEWKNIRYMVFDLPLVNRPFYERYEIMTQLIKDIPYVELVEHTLIESEEQFNKTYKKLIDKGAEGVMLRNPDSYYEQKRSSNLLKVKDFLDDEVIVEDMEYGTGKYSNVMGNLIVRWAKHSPNAKKTTNTFRVGSGFSDEEREKWKTLFKKGTLLTIRYFELTNTGKPRFPSFQNIYYKV